MSASIVVLLLSAVFLLYGWIIYPLVLAVWATLRRRDPVLRTGEYPRNAAIVVAAYNEAATVGRRLTELDGLRRAAGLTGPLILVSDGSTDATADTARESGVATVIELTRHRGKAAALSSGIGACKNADFVVFADVRQRFDGDTLPCLLAPFGDPGVGATSGILLLGNRSGISSGVAAYWKFELWLRQQESRIHSMLGVSGAVCAARRSRLEAIPDDVILDDMFWPCRIVLAGGRVVLASGARAYDQLPARGGDEFRRKVRTLTGNFQLIGYLPALLSPRRNPVFVQFVSHKVFRLMAPWLLGVAVVAAAIGEPGATRMVVLSGAATGLLLGLSALCSERAAMFRPAAVLGAFLLLNAAACVALVQWLSGDTGGVWVKSTYRGDV